MANKQIFISHSNVNKQFAEKLYSDLLSDGYWVWMDASMEPAEKWEPQIDENLRKSEKFIALISSEFVQSDWVKHEGAMALALNQEIIPVNIEENRKYPSKALPIWARPYHLFPLYQGSAKYTDQYETLKRRLGQPVPIRQYFLEMLRHFRLSHVLLDEVGLALVERHFDDFHLTEEEKVTARELIEESRFRLASYWIRHDKLKKAYQMARNRGLSLKLELDSQRSETIRYRFLAAFIASILVIYILVVACVFL